MACADAARHPARVIALTGGPGAGKTAVLEVLRRDLAREAEILPEAASIVFKGGFPRRPSQAAGRAAQRAIYRVQSELERLAGEERTTPLILCDRGTLDGLAYWPGDPASYFADLATTMAIELARYHTVIHLRTPSVENGYDHTNPVRIESVAEARAIDDRILAIWADHPRRHVVASTPHFLDKLDQVAELVEAELPECCRPRSRRAGRSGRT